MDTSQIQKIVKWMNVLVGTFNSVKNAGYNIFIIDDRSNYIILDVTILRVPGKSYLYPVWRTQSTRDCMDGGREMYIHTSHTIIL